MKNVKIVLVILIAAFFTACTKNDIVEDSLIQGLSSGSGQASVISSWENGNQWNRTDSSGYLVFSIDRSIPDLSQEVLNEGAVLVFVKNIILDDNRRVDRPIKIPFHVLPSIGKPGYDQVWYSVSRPGHISVKYRTNKHQYGTQAQLPDQSVQVRYFVISPSELDKYDHTPASISRLNYGQLVDLLGTAY